jgi:hypothetical protein
MRALLLAFVLSIPFLTPSSGHASIKSGPDFIQSQQNSAADHVICDKVRYNFGIPWVDDAMADAFMADCLGKMSLLTEPRPILHWQESAEEAERLCTAYTKQDRFDPVSDMLLIVETNDFDECMRAELWH